MSKAFRGDYAVYCCQHVFRKQRPILLVVRDFDGDWQFLCGKNDDSEKCHTIGVGHLLDADVTLESIANLLIGTGAERDTIETDWDFFELQN